jgi:nicotinate-nucleotide adenylyltransferase
MSSNAEYASTAARIGLFGGTFDPIHVGHLMVAVRAFEQLQLDQVLFIPNGMPPHKQNKTDIRAAEHRYRMVQRAVEGDARFAVSSIEITHSGPSFTVDTVRELVRVAQLGTRFFFILGDDCVGNLHRWQGIAELMTLVQFVSVPRTGACADDSISRRVTQLDMQPMRLSSSQLRADLAQGCQVGDRLPQAVTQYILEHRLYKAVEEIT